MDIKAYIESGILEAYALGFASEAEVRDVEQNMLLFPELKAELDEIRAALDSNAVSYAKLPPREAKEAVHKRLFSGKDAFKVTQTSRTMPWTAIAASIAIIALGANIWLYSQYKSVKQQLSLMEADKIEFANAIDQLQVKYSISENNLAFFTRPDLKKIEMKPVANKVDQSATAYWSQASGQLMINVKELPAPPTGHQYQLWAIVDGQPLDLGLYDPSATFQEMKQVAAPQAFAVTLEKEGGSIVPTMEQMVVMGGV